MGLIKAASGATGGVLAYSQFQNPFIQILLSYNEFCQRIGFHRAIHFNRRFNRIR